jgi:23S rRNA (cytidine1920-2'-O)/16S rRNA (cytidine1409-2'-O)-methyltransferase
MRSSTLSTARTGPLLHRDAPVAVRRQRLDVELVRRGLARSRQHAGELIAGGRVRVAGMVATKAATAVATDAPVQVLDDPQRPDYVSRGGRKLAGALDSFSSRGLDVTGRDALDAGASTGGFTDVLLRYGARTVTAVDVGYGQIAWTLRGDDRVTVVERTHVNDLTHDQLGASPDVVVADLSFISLTKVMDALISLAEPEADFVLLVKPQFEVGRAALGRGGVVRDPQLRADAVVRVASSGAEGGLGVRGICASPLPGPAGNVEYFLWMHHAAPVLQPELVASVVAAGPQ